MFKAISSSRGIGFLVVFGLFFNAMLAFVNAHGIGINTMIVMAMEGLTLAGIAAAVAPVYRREMRPWLVFSYLYMIIFLWLLMFNWFLGQDISPKPLRDILLISAFGMLGMAYADKGGNIFRLVCGISIAVVVVMLVENYWTDLYSSMLNIAQYYINTRGYEERNIAGMDDFNLFYNTALIEGRFTLGFLTTHRLSSLFLEQTSLGNFSIMLSMFCGVFWDKMSVRQRVILVGSVILTLMGTDSRLALGFALIVLFSNAYIHRLPPRLNLLVMPILLFVSYLLFYDPTIRTIPGDDLRGRFSWSLAQLSWVDVQGFFGGKPWLIGESMDAGYCYMIYSQTFFGLVGLWLFSSLILPPTTVEARRMRYYLSLFMALNLMVGSTLFSIKCAALLWFMVGYVYAGARIPQPVRTARKVAVR